MFAGISDPYLTIYTSNSASQFAVEKINKNFIDLHNWGKVAIFLLTKCFNMYYEELQNSSLSDFSVNEPQLKDRQENTMALNLCD